MSTSFMKQSAKKPCRTIILGRITHRITALLGVGFVAASVLALPSAARAAETETAEDSVAEAAPEAAVTTTVAGLEFPLPQGWEVVPPASQMRVAQWEVAEGDARADVVFFFFGRDQGGSVDANFARWLGQFREPTEELNPQKAEFSGERGKVHILKVQGTYNASMPGQPQPDQPDTLLIGAVVEGAEGNVFIRFNGPNELVAAQEQVFLQSLATAAGAKLEAK